MEEVILGDFLQWLILEKWFIRGIEFIEKVNQITHKDNKPGWRFQFCNEICYVSDEDIRQIVPPKTPDQWDAWGR